MTIQVSMVPDAVESTVKLKGDRTAYLQELLQLRPNVDSSVPWLQELRDRAAAIVQELAIPSTRVEEWRFTDLSPLLQENFQSATATSATVLPSAIESFRLPEAANSRLVFVNGVYAPELSAIADLPPGVMVGNLAQTSTLGDRITQLLAKQQGAEETFTALNTASMVDAAVIFVPKNQAVEVPIHVLFVTTATESTTLAHPRCLVIAESGSRLTLVEDFIGVGDRVYFNNPVTEIWLEDNAEVDHTRVQRDSHAAFHIGKTAVSQARDSRYHCTAVNLGASLSRHHLEVYQTGEQTSTTLNGLTMIGGEQLGDTHSIIAFTKPYGTSKQVNKCIAKDRAHAVFNGTILVPRAAQLTNAAQVSRNLLLSPKARVDTKPQLEITADNVKCSHGATVSQLEDDAVFYLQSRGINQAESRKLLTYAFAIEVIDQIPVTSLRNTLAADIRSQQA